MNDPHVERLRYHLKANSVYYPVQFENPLPLFKDCGDFSIRLENENLTVEMKEHYATEEAAKKKVEEFLRDWLNWARFDFEWDLLYFKYERAEVIDRNPPPTVPGQCTLGCLNAGTSPRTFKATSTPLPLKVSEYPAPPTRFKATTEVETMWFRYQQYLQDKETCQSFGYFCLTLMESSTGIKKNARKEASRIYKIKEDVLRKLSELTTVTGTQRDARKLKLGCSTGVPLTLVERQWICKAVKMLIRRKGEYDFDTAAGSSLEQITMNDLPKL